jgi:hypothetical protein
MAPAGLRGGAPAGPLLPESAAATACDKVRAAANTSTRRAFIAWSPLAL